MDLTLHHCLSLFQTTTKALSALPVTTELHMHAYLNTRMTDECPPCLRIPASHTRRIWRTLLAAYAIVMRMGREG